MLLVLVLVVDDIHWASEGRSWTCSTTSWPVSSRRLLDPLGCVKPF